MKVVLFTGVVAGVIFLACASTSQKRVQGDLQGWYYQRKAMHEAAFNSALADSIANFDEVLCEGMKNLSGVVAVFDSSWNSFYRNWDSVGCHQPMSQIDTILVLSDQEWVSALYKGNPPVDHFLRLFLIMDGDVRNLGIGKYRCIIHDDFGELRCEMGFYAGSI